MTDLVLLKRAIDESGIPVSTSAKRSNIRRESLYNKIAGKTEFKASEMEAVSKVLKLTDSQRIEIFFAK